MTEKDLNLTNQGGLWFRYIIQLPLISHFKLSEYRVNIKFYRLSNDVVLEMFIHTSYIFNEFNAEPVFNMYKQKKEFINNARKGT